MNTKKQSSIGVALAIAYYTEQECAVFIPVSDVSRYDFIIDRNGELLKVEVKSTRSQDGTVDLRTKGGNQSWDGEVKRISKRDCDLVFAINLLTKNFGEYPAEDLEGRATVTIR